MSEGGAEGAAFDPFPVELANCRLCPRLATYREEVALTKRRAFEHETYWGRPVPGFGDPRARIVLLGLAPGAHGSNRTGRMFTGDASGDFLYPALHRAGLASQPIARGRDDGMTLAGVWITAACRCVPPGNKPTPGEVATCRTWLAYDLQHLPDARVIVALGRIAHDAYLDWLASQGHDARKSRVPFEHGRLHDLPAGPPLLDTYHVSRQNTNTGRLTADMFDGVLERAKALAAD